MEMEPATRTTLAETVAEQILSLILANDLGAGDKLPSEKELVEQLQVGRSTVREALKSLSALGIVDMRPGHGTSVKRLDARKIMRPDLLALMIDKTLTERLLEAREIIEPEIANLAAQRATEEDLAAIHEVLHKTEEAIQAGQPVYRLSPEFHRALADAAHNEVLLMFMDSISTLLMERGLFVEKKPGYV